MKEVRALSATGMLGSGFREDSLKRAMALKPDFIGADSGSTDPGPHHLGSGEGQFSDSAYKRDLRLMLLAAIHSEQDKGYLKRKLREGRVKPLANAPTLDDAVIDRSAHVVGMCGIEPYVEAMQNGAEVIIAGRSSDTSIFSALPVMKGLNPATVWHAAKILECGADCVVLRKYPDCMFAAIRDDSFIIEPPNPEYRCDPATVASHSLYENGSPYELVEPSGVLDTIAAKYEAVSDRAVKVSEDV